MSLATTVDLVARMGTAITNEDRAEALLADASASVIAYTGQTFQLAEETVRLQVRNGRIRLPQRPVVDVSAIEDTDGNTVTFTWHSGSTIELSAIPINWFEVEPRRNSLRWVDVTYEHGYETVPADIVAVVCQIAARAYGRPAEDAGVQQETIAGYSYSVGAAAAAGGLGLLNDEKAVLDRYRIPIGSAVFG